MESIIKSKNLKKYIVFISPTFDFSSLRTSQSVLCSGGTLLFGGFHKAWNSQSCTKPLILARLA